jgi:preprotein translocase subunit SecB
MLTRFMLDIFLERPETKRTSHAVKSLVDFEVDYMAFFKFADSNTIPKETEFFETFALREGIQCCHPYIQEHISNMIARMGLPPLMLGLSDLDLSVMEPPITASSK